MTFAIRTATRAGVAASLALVLLAPLGGQVRKLDAERLLADRFRFSAAEIAQARGGKAVTKLLSTREANEVGVGGAVHVTGTPDRLVYWLKDIAAFRRALEIGVSKKLSSPPQSGDFAELTLNPEDLAAIRGCRPGKCDLRLGDVALVRFQKEVDWKAPDAGQRANALTQQLMLKLAQAYLQGGDLALGTAHNETTPRVSADEFHALLSQTTAVYELVPPFAAYLERFPNASLPNSEQFLYWANGGAGSDASISLHQVVISSPPGGEVMIADKQLYASRYTDAILTVISLVPDSDGRGYYALVGARARSTMLAGMMARALRGRVEAAAVDTARMYLNWLQQSLAMAR